MNLQDRLIVALDVSEEAEALKFVRQLRDTVGMFKVGSQLFLNTGPRLVQQIIESGARVFLDLKFHDIPHQVAGAARAATELGVSMFTVHASGGSEMLRRTMEEVREADVRADSYRPKVVAVTVLTSLDRVALSEIGMRSNSADSVTRLAMLAGQAGVDGVVASAQEAELIRNQVSREFLIVTPGIRPETSEHADQKRVMTPRGALAAGADYLVVGRPITSAPDPVEASQAILAEMEAAIAPKRSGTANSQ
ncbi:MAG: orotidine-5'-phosphate decarboxylase [Pyrinomonadaceae bacterium]